MILLHGHCRTLEPITPFWGRHPAIGDTSASQASSPPLIAGPRSGVASQVLAFQAQPPVVAVTVTNHQPISQPFSLGLFQAMPGKQVNPRSEGVNLGCVHRRGVRP